MDLLKTLPPIEGETRERLLEAGLRLFALRGFEGVSVREIAKLARANVAAIGYHFGGKEDLYKAVIDQAVVETDPTIGPVMIHLRAGLATAKGDRRALTELVVGFVHGLLAAFIQDERMRIRAGLILREYIQPTDAFEILFKKRIEPLHRAVTALVAAATGMKAENPACIVRAHALLGQIIIFFLARVVLWARLEWNGYAPENLALITDEITASVLGSLGLAPRKDAS